MAGQLNLFGTGRYLLVQTLLVLTWIVLNLFAVICADPYPFILLNLAFHAGLRAPHRRILLAQNRQEKRPRGVRRGSSAGQTAPICANARELAAVAGHREVPRATTCHELGQPAPVGGAAPTDPMWRQLRWLMRREQHAKKSGEGRNEKRN